MFFVSWVKLKGKGVLKTENARIVTVYGFGLLKYTKLENEKVLLKSIVAMF